MSTRRTATLFENGTVRTYDLFSVESVGVGPNVLFIPGHGSSKHVWGDAARELCAGYRVHLIQVAGMAGVAPPRHLGGAAMEALVTAIGCEFLPQLGGRTTVIGHSMGGAVGLALAQRWSEGVDRLMVVDAFPFVGIPITGLHSTVDDLKPMRESLVAGGPPATMAMLAGSVPMWARAPAARQELLDEVNAGDPAILHAYLLALLTLDLRPDLGSLRVPVMVVHGDHAALGEHGATLAALFEAAYANVPKLQRRCIQDSLHFVMLDQPKAFSAAVRHFLQ